MHQNLMCTIVKSVSTSSSSPRRKLTSQRGSSRRMAEEGFAMVVSIKEG